MSSSIVERLDSFLKFLCVSSKESLIAGLQQNNSQREITHIAEKPPCNRAVKDPGFGSRGPGQYSPIPLQEPIYYIRAETSKDKDKIR